MENQKGKMRIQKRYQKGQRQVDHFNLPGTKSCNRCYNAYNSIPFHTTELILVGEQLTLKLSNLPLFQTFIFLFNFIIFVNIILVKIYTINVLQNSCTNNLQVLLILFGGLAQVPDLQSHLELIIYFLWDFGNLLKHFVKNNIDDNFQPCVHFRSSLLY